MVNYPSCGFNLPCWQTAAPAQGLSAMTIEVGSEGWAISAISKDPLCGALSGASNLGQGVNGYSGPGASGNAFYNPPAGVAALGDSVPGLHAESWSSNGVQGISYANTASGVYGENMTAGAGWCYGVAGRSKDGIGVLGDITEGGWAGYFNGKVHIVGGTHSPADGIQIDHPLEPTSKYLNHSSVESSEMKNVYDGVVTLDSEGSGWIELPAWFEALNGDFRYQLTPIGSHAPVYVADEIANNRFRVAGGKPGQKISWQVTGIRRDAWATKHAIEVEEGKEPEFRGKFLHPVEAGQPKEMGIPYLITNKLKSFAERPKKVVAVTRPT